MVVSSLRVLAGRGTHTGLPSVVVLASLLLPQPLPAQTPMAGDVSSAEFAHQIRALSADSLQVREAPSGALERAAQYVADQFRGAGLTPGGDDGTWFQRYPVPGRLQVDYETSQVAFIGMLGRGSRKIASESGNEIWKTVPAGLTSAARFILPPSEVVPWSGADRPVVVLAGRHTVSSVRQANLDGKVVIYAPPFGEDSAARQHVVDEIKTTTRWLVLLDDRDSAGFAGAVTRARQHPMRLVDSYLYEAASRRGMSWTVAVPGTVLEKFLAGAGIDLGRVRADATPVVEELPLSAVSVQVSAAKGDNTPPKIPNVVGVLEGADPKLKDQCLVVTTRLDAADSRAAGLVALAMAFRRSKIPLRRSVVFVALSEGNDRWGSNVFLAQGVRKAVAHLAIDVAGLHAGDSVAVYGASDLDLASPPAWTAASHPDLGLILNDGGTAFQPASDGFTFAAHGIPSLSLGRRREDPVRDSRRSSGTDPERSAHVLQLAYYVGEAIANGDRPPRWSADGRRQLMAVPTP